MTKQVNGGMKMRVKKKVYETNLDESWICSVWPF